MKATIYYGLQMESVLRRRIEQESTVNDQLRSIISELSSARHIEWLNIQRFADVVKRNNESNRVKKTADNHSNEVQDECERDRSAYMQSSTGGIP